MIIKEKDFELRQVSDTAPHWDLYLMRTINAKSKSREAREELVLEGYAYTLGGAIHAIANYRLNKGDDIMNLKEYIEKYNKVVEDLYKVTETVVDEPELME